MLGWYVVFLGFWVSILVLGWVLFKMGGMEFNLFKYILVKQGYY